MIVLVFIGFGKCLTRSVFPHKTQESASYAEPRPSERVLDGSASVYDALSEIRRMSVRLLIARRDASHLPSGAADQPRAFCIDAGAQRRQ